MSYPNIISEISGSHWFMREEAVVEMAGVIRDMSAGDVQKWQALEQEAEPLEAMYELTGNGTAVVPVRGKIMPRANLMSMMSGGVSVSKLTSLTRQLDADSDVRRVLFTFDSPGGSPTGLTGLAQAIRQMDTPTMSFAEGGMYSAAYYIGSAADELYVSPTGGVGSIGVYTMLVSHAERLENEGIDVKVIRSTPLKAKGHSSEPIDEDTVKKYQQQVNSLHREFARNVALNRNLSLDFVLQDMATGEVKMGADAAETELADGVKTLADVIEDFELNTSAAETETEQLLAHVQSEYKALSEEHAELAEEVAEKESYVETLEEQLDEVMDNAESQAVEQAADRLIAEERKVAPAKREQLIEALEEDFDGTMKRFALVSEGAAAPRDFPTEGGGDSKDFEAKVREAEKEGKFIAYDQSEADIYASMGKDYVMADDLR